MKCDLVAQCSKVAQQHIEPFHLEQGQTLMYLMHR